MSVKLALLALLVAFPPKPSTAMTWKEISLSGALGFAQLMAGVKLELRDLNGAPLKITGRLQLLKVQKRNKIVTGTVEGMVIEGDPLKGIPPTVITDALLFYNLHTGAYYLKAKALGGIVELEGVY